MGELHEALYKHAKKDITPWHMPGHKRKLEFNKNAYELDITEIEGFDNLHYSTGILKAEQEKASKLFGAKKTLFLVSGSTVGILTAIAAAVPSGGKLIMARNCHKAAYNGAYLRGIKTDYLIPAKRLDGLMGEITPAEVERLIEKNLDGAAVFITSPTYDGVVSDIEKISKIAHAHGMLLIVDAAHGAHFGFNKDFPESPVNKGADIVIMSTHKTLPSPTQTALLHICSDLVDVTKVERFFDCYETSSPSYLLMTGISDCVEIIDSKGDELFKRFSQNLDDFYEKIADLKHLKLARTDDKSKIIIKTDGVTLEDKALTGYELYDMLRVDFGQELEMATADYVLAIATVMDEKSDFDRLRDAILEIDKKCGSEKPKDYDTDIYVTPQKKYDLYQALDMDTEELNVDKTAGRVSAQWIYAYPPGIPVVVPGEIISSKIALGFAADVDKFYPIGYNNSVKVIKEET